MGRHIHYGIAFLVMTICSFSISGGIAQALQSHRPVLVADNHERSQAYFCKCSVEKISCYSGGFQAAIPDDMEAQLKAECQAYFENQVEGEAPIRYFWIYR